MSTPLPDLDSGKWIFVPAHISLYFSIHDNSNVLEKGSTGVGICLPTGLGVFATSSIKPATSTNITTLYRVNNLDEIEKQAEGIADDPVTKRAISLVLKEPSEVVVHLEQTLPIGHGFGISGASALAACLTITDSISDAYRASHMAEVEYKTGLGDVAAQAASLRKRRKNQHPLKHSPEHAEGFSVVIRNAPGFNESVEILNPSHSFFICLQGDGTDTTQVLNDNIAISKINKAFSQIKPHDFSIPNIISSGLSFSKSAGLLSSNSSEIISSLPDDSVATIVHLGTAIIVSGVEADAMQILYRNGKLIGFDKSTNDPKSFFIINKDTSTNTINASEFRSC